MRRYQWLAAVLLVCAFVVPCLAPNTLITISGIVRGPDGPVSGVEVWTEHRPYPGMITGLDGRYELQIETGRTAEIIAIPEATSGLATGSVMLSAIESRILDFSLAPGNWLTGRVVSEESFPIVVDHDIVDSTGAKHVLGMTHDGRFARMFPPDVYQIHLSETAANPRGKSVRVDLRQGNVEDLVIRVQAHEEETLLHAWEYLDVPDASRIRFSSTDVAWMTEIVGDAGAIPWDIDSISLTNLTSGDTAVAAVAADGSFSTKLFAPPEAAVYIKWSWGGQYERGPRLGTIVRVPNVSPVDGLADNIPFTINGTVGAEGHWWVEGTVSHSKASPGESLSIRGTLFVESHEFANVVASGHSQLTANVELERLFDESGEMVLRSNRGMSTWVTPTGIPIENWIDGRMSRYSPAWLEEHILVRSRYRSGDRVEIPFQLELDLPTSTPHGLYRPAMAFWLHDGSGLHPNYGSNDQMAERASAENGELFLLPAVSVGTHDTPRIPWTLLTNTVSNGVRGVRAREDSASFDVSSRITYQNDALILPPHDPLRGTPQTYRLEPFLPTVSSSLAGDVEPNAPRIPFALPSGELTVTVERPDGQTDTLGPAPFIQSRTGMTSSKHEYYIGPDRTLQGIYELTTCNGDFDYAFNDYGHYIVRMQGYVEDIWGNRYDGVGTYDVYVAETLDLETAAFPGTPFEVGDRLNPSVVVHPSVPAQISVRLRHYPNSDPNQVITWSVEGTANRYGVFSGEELSMAFEDPGEYVVDTTASYWSEDGVFWMGKLRGASVVASPANQLIPHGERGLKNLDDPRPQWFFQSDIHPEGLPFRSPEADTLTELADTMLLLPYQNGDVVWAGHRKDNTINDLTFHDPIGLLSSIVLERGDQFPAHNEAGGLDQRALLGEMPFISTTPQGWDDTQYPDEIDQVGYFYMAVGRPGVSIRGYAAQDGLQRTYWTTDYLYNRQLGSGYESDRPDDTKYQFGGGVFRLLNGPGTSDDVNEYLAFGSCEIVVGMDDLLGNRVTPPFQGNGGGPDGGPLFFLRGEPIDMFLSYTDMQPGGIYELGAAPSMGGHVFPTLPADVEVAISSPTGETVTTNQRANAVGYVVDSLDALVLDEEGRYTVHTTLIYDGATSGGQLLPPFPTGSVLGAADGAFEIYVVAPGTPGIEFENLHRHGTLPCSMIPWTLRGAIPDGWTNAQLHYTATMPGVILEQGTAVAEDGTVSYTFDARELHKDFPNLDIGEAPNRFPELADTLTLSFLLAGEDGEGNPAFRVGRIDLQGLSYTVPEWMIAVEPLDTGSPQELLNAGASVGQVIELVLPHGTIEIELVITRDEEAGEDVYEYIVRNLDHCGFGTFAVANNGVRALAFETSPGWGGGDEGGRWVWDGDQSTSVAGREVVYTIAVPSPSTPIYGTVSLWPSRARCTGLTDADRKVDFEMLTPSGA